MYDESRIMWISNIEQVFISSMNTLELIVNTVLNNNLLELGAFVGLWFGLDSLQNMDDLLAYTSLSIVPDRQCALPITITVCPEINLFDGIYTVGLFLNAVNPNSLVASVSLLQGKARYYQQSAITVLSHTPKIINCFYSVPDHVKPGFRLDWVILHKGYVPVINNSNMLAHTNIQSNKSSGTAIIDVEHVFLEPGDYIVQYNLGHSMNTVSAAFTFSLA